MAFLVPFNIIVVLFVIIIFLSAIVSFKRLKITDKTLKLFMLLLIMCIWGIFTVGFSYGLLTFFTYFPAIILYSIPLNKQIRTLNFVTKWFSILMIGSISIFIITRVVHFGPPMGVLQLSSQNYDPFNNYILFIESTSIFNLIFYRFNGPFLEPGHLSLICSLLLFANQYRFKENRYLWVLLVCVLLSFSLAGYLISALGYILLKIRSIKLFLYSGIIFGSMFIFVSYVWNEGNNPINTLIFSRMEVDEEKGIAGNNRTTEQTDDYFSKNFNNGKLWIGLGTNEKDDTFIRGSGYKIYFIRYGIISFIFVLFFYYNLIPQRCNHRYAIIFLLLIVLIFIQRAYPGWYSWLFCFTLGCGSTRIIKVKHRLRLNVD